MLILNNIHNHRDSRRIIIPGIILIVYIESIVSKIAPSQHKIIIVSYITTWLRFDWALCNRESPIHDLGAILCILCISLLYRIECLKFQRGNFHPGSIAPSQSQEQVWFSTRTILSLWCTKGKSSIDLGISRYCKCKTGLKAIWNSMATLLPVGEHFQDMVSFHIDTDILYSLLFYRIPTGQERDRAIRSDHTRSKGMIV